MDMPAVCAALQAGLPPTDVPEQALDACGDPARESLLAEYRRILRARVADDAAVNLMELRSLAAEVGARSGFAPQRSARGAAMFARLGEVAAELGAIDPYVDGRVELQWWLAIHQFYLDGLSLADRMLAAASGRRAPWWNRSPEGIEVLGLSLPSKIEALVTAMELSVPNVFRSNPFDTYVPTLLHILAHQVFPGKRFRITDLFEASLGWVRRRGFERMRGVAGPVVRFHGTERLHDGLLIEPDTGRTRHNLIIAAHHRFGYLDIPLFWPPLRHLRLAVWANNAFYGPGMEAKIGRDPYSVPVRGRHRPPIAEMMSRTAGMLVHARAPVFLMADGAQPPLIYGQQMRVKSGLRLAVDATLRASAGTGRRTYVMPLTFNDPAGFVQGVRDTIDVRFHAPILIETPRDSQPRDAAEPEAAVNGGDPLLNYLEALYITETTHATHGLPSPRIVPAARARAAAKSSEPVLKRLFPTTIADLARATHSSDRNPQGQAPRRSGA